MKPFTLRQRIMELRYSFLFLFLMISVVSSTEEKCSSICPFNDSFDLDTPIEEIIMKVLTRDGPSDGVCLTGDKWIMNGTQFGLPSKCICYNIPKGTEISQENGQKCPNYSKASVQETLAESWIRNYELHKNDAPEDGWCPEGKTKWILESTLVNIPRDLCLCIDGFDWYSPEVVCI
ncbi:CLUMA_CG000863, isoform A [Clunio marinus]|uniref:CLUMA_CG000863, isoform A n=1 Tax=Clunio marinus TaxID=568069 RepID=A0A1J1HGE2_9DIPT|nr:CLUMA_CG000863, isoform A [Clunio marinus]